MSRFLAWVLFVLGLLGSTRYARAEEPLHRPVLVMDVADDVPVDATALRESLARDLGAHVVRRDDPTAKLAVGKLEVRRRETGVSIEYRATGTAIERAITLPADDAQAMRALTQLAGNLARDESADLLRQEPRRNAQEATAPVTDDAKSESDRLVTLTSTLNALSANEGRLTGLQLGGAAALGGGSVLIGIGARSLSTPGGIASMVAGSTVVAFSGGALVHDSSAEDFAALRASIEAHRGEVASGARLAELVETEWRERAQAMRNRRHITAGVLVVLAAAAELANVVLLREGSSELRSGLMSGGMMATMFALGTIVTPSKTERALRDYEAGRAAQSSTGEIRVAVVPVSSGAMLSLGATF